MNIDNIEKILSHYPNLLQIVLWSLGSLIAFIVFLYNFLKNKSKRILLNFSLSSSIICPNSSITYLKITNNKTEKLIADKIELVLFDDKNTYSIDIYSKSIIVEPESYLELNIEPVSHYGLKGEFVDIAHLFMEKKNFYFIFHNGSKKIYVDKKWFLKSRIENRLSPFKIKFEDEIHSIDWDYGFVYKDSITTKDYVGFMNKRQVFCRHICTDIFDKDTFTSEILLQELSLRGCIDIKIKKLILQNREYTQTIPRILGKIENRKKDTGTMENPHILTDKDILSFTKEV